MATLVANQKQRDQAILTAIQGIEKQYGKGAVLRLGQGNITPIDVIPTGCLSLDGALGVGGVPRGRVVEVYGPESSGKTTIALQIVAQAQKVGGTAVFIDAEHALDPIYARQLGVNVDDLLLSQPDYGEQALEIAEALVASYAVDVVVVDSVAALVPKAELDGEMGDSFMGVHARLMSQALRKLTGIVHRTGTCFIFINQIREKIGVVFGNPETTTGGRALKFYSSIRLDVRRIGTVKDGDAIVGNRTKIKVVKNKMAPPFREVEVDLIHGEGTSLEAELLDIGAEKKVIEKNGSWYTWKAERLGQGRESARQFLKQNPETRDRLFDEVRAAMGIAAVAVPAKPVASASAEAAVKRVQGA
jgi:recombination protein RecA